MSRQKKTELCPLGGVGVSGKLKFWIWWRLLSGTKRFGELQRLIPQASRQMLTMQLRELEQVGVIDRQVYAVLPPKVEYTLTDISRQSEPMMRQFYAWGRWCAAEMGLDFDDWLMLMSGRWLFWIWWHLLSGTKRFSELQRLLPQANQQILSVQLRELERIGVIRRQVSAQGAAKVEYSLTPMGQQSGPMMRGMHMWARWICDQLGLEFDWPLGDETLESVQSLLTPADSAAMWELTPALNALDGLTA